MRHFIAGAFVSGLVIASASHAGGTSDGIAWTDDFKIWESAPLAFAYPKSWVTDFAEFNVGATPAGSYPQLTGGAGWSGWTLSSPGSDLTANEKLNLVYATANGASLHLDFTGKPDADGSGLHGVGGNFLLIDGSGSFTAELRFELSNGQAYHRSISKTTPFLGFWVTDADPAVTITSMTIMPTGLTPPSFSIGIENLHLGYAGVAIPAPGALALLAAAGLIAGRRRR